MRAMSKTTKKVSIHSDAYALIEMQAHFNHRTPNDELSELIRQSVTDKTKERTWERDPEIMQAYGHKRSGDPNDHEAKTTNATKVSTGNGATNTQSSSGNNDQNTDVEIEAKYKPVINKNGREQPAKDPLLKDTVKRMYITGDDKKMIAKYTGYSENNIKNYIDKWIADGSLKEKPQDKKPRGRKSAKAQVEKPTEEMPAQPAEKPVEQTEPQAGPAAIPETSSAIIVKPSENPKEPEELRVCDTDGPEIRAELRKLLDDAPARNEIRRLYDRGEHDYDKIAKQVGYTVLVIYRYVWYYIEKPESQ
jgi:hypothetical protein